MKMNKNSFNIVDVSIVNVKEFFEKLVGKNIEVWKVKNLPSHFYPLEGFEMQSKETEIGIMLKAPKFSMFYLNDEDFFINDTSQLYITYGIYYFNYTDAVIITYDHRTQSNSVRKRVYKRHSKLLRH